MIDTLRYSSNTSRADAPPSSIRTLEVELVLKSAAMATRSSPSRGSPRSDLSGINWPSILELCKAHSITALVADTLLSAEASTLSHGVRGHLDSARRFTHLRNLQLLTELIRIRELFEGHSIDLTPLKGPVLALSAYGELALRGSGDLDLLVRRGDLERASSLLATHGYSLPAARSRIAQGHAITLTNGRFDLDLHTELVQPYFCSGLNARTFLERRVVREFRGAHFRVLCPEDEFLYLCVHGTKHAWQQLRWVCDLAAFVDRRVDLDWRELMELARGSGTSRMLGLGILLASDLLRAPFPEWVVASVRTNRVVRTQARKVARWMFEGDFRARNQLQRVAFNLSVQRRSRDRLGYIAHLLRDSLSPYEADLDTEDPRVGAYSNAVVRRFLRVAKREALPLLVRSSRTKNPRSRDRLGTSC